MGLVVNGGGRKHYTIMVEVFNFSSLLLCSAGVAGCMATVLHDAVMNPAEGKPPFHMTHTHTHTHTYLRCTVCTVVTHPPS